MKEKMPQIFDASPVLLVLLVRGKNVLRDEQRCKLLAIMQLQREVNSL